MLPAAIVDNVVDLSLLDFLAEAALKQQKAIAKARRYHDGEQAVFLTSRLRAFLGIDLDDDSRFNMNLCRIVVEAVTERLIVEAFDAADEDLAEWAMATWKANRMDARADDTHVMAVRDGESFVIVDWDEENERPRLTPHPRFVAVDADGDGFGFEMYYPDDDTSQRPLYAVKRWIEHPVGQQARARATFYFSDRIEKYVYASGWVPFQDPDDTAWPLPWVDASGEPLGIPVIHFQNKALRSEAWDAIPIQDGINKTFLDLLASSDLTAFRIFVALGFIPTTDGKDLADDQSNALTIEPGQFIGTTKKAGEADFKAIDGADVTPMVNMLQKLILFLAMVTNTPVGRFQITGMVSAEQSQKQAEEPLLNKVRNRQTVFGDAWEDVMDMARRLENLYGESLNEDDELTVRWAEAQARSQDETHAELKLKKELGIPLRQLWSELGYDEAKIDEMLQEPEVRNRTFTDFP
jgi:hypothetical protein